MCALASFHLSGTGAATVGLSPIAAYAGAGWSASARTVATHNLAPTVALGAVAAALAGATRGCALGATPPLFATPPVTLPLAPHIPIPVPVPSDAAAMIPDVPPEDDEIAVATAAAIALAAAKAIMEDED